MSKTIRHFRQTAKTAIGTYFLPVQIQVSIFIWYIADTDSQLPTTANADLVLNSPSRYRLLVQRFRVSDIPVYL